MPRIPGSDRRAASEVLERQREWAVDGETDAADASVALPGGGDAPEMFLVARQGDRLSVVDLVDPGEWIVGRAADVAIPVDDRQVSRSHARVRLVNDTLTVEDLGSRNGTRINGHTLARTTQRMAVGDVIEVGPCQILVGARNGRASEARSVMGDGATSTEVVVADPEMAKLYADLRKVARMPTTVLILGETGSGKDVLAQRLHASSPRATRPFVRINCAGMPESLLESELFGHERGAFTGADRRRVGYFEAAAGGTIFLDEVGELSASAQVRLLHVLENKTVTRLGGTTPIPIDARVVCATHRDLKAMVGDGGFRADLYYRMSPFVLRVPPLRERAAEVPLFCTTFLRRLADQVGSSAPAIAPDAMAMLVAYSWPGNVRELRNSIEHAFVMAEGATLRREHFLPEMQGQVSPASRAAPPVALRERRADAERQAIEEALAAEGGNQTRAAVRLGMPRRTLVHKLTQYRRQGDAGAPGRGGEHDED